MTLHGFAVFPQILLAALRPDLCSVDPYLQYSAIGSLTVNYLKSLSNVKNLYDYTNSQNKFREDLSKSAKRKLRQEGWVIVSYNV